MVYKIIVCDDDPDSFGRMQEALEEAAGLSNMELDISYYKHAKDCLQSIEQEAPDAVILDVEMPEMTGMELAKRIRQADADLILMFCSSYVDYVFESFEVTPLRYIRKNNLKKDIRLALQAMTEVIRMRQPVYITLQSEDGNEEVEVGDLQYIELIRKRMYFHIAPDRELVIKMNMKKLRSIIKEEDERFVLINSGTLVNAGYIKAYTRQDVTLFNGKKLPIARRRYEQVKDRILLNWSKRKYRRSKETI